MSDINFLLHSSTKDQRNYAKEIANDGIITYSLSDTHSDIHANWFKRIFDHINNLTGIKFEKKDTFFTSGKRFIPPAALKSELDCIDLDFYQDGINTKCELVFDLQEKSIADYFKTIVRLDKVKKEIIFSQSELLDENLKPKDHVIAKKLANEIEQVLTNNGN